MRVLGLQWEVGLSLLAVLAVAAAQVDTSSTTWETSPTLAVGARNRRDVRPRYLGGPRIGHAEKDSPGQAIELELNLGEVQDGNDHPFPVGPRITMLPVGPFWNQTRDTDRTTTVTLSNGNMVEIEQHVNMVFSGGTPPSIGDLPPLTQTEAAVPHLISVELPLAATTSLNDAKNCAGRGTVTITRTVQVTSTMTKTFTRYATSTRTITRAHIGTKPTEPESQPSSVEQSQPSTVVHTIGVPKTKPKPTKAEPKPQPKSEPKAEPEPESKPVPEPEPDPEPEVKPEVKPEPRPEPSPEPQPQAPKVEVPPGFDSEMVGQHNRWRAKYGAGPLAHDPELAGKAQDWLNRCVWEHPPGLASNLYSSGSTGGSAPDRVKSANDAVNAWVNGPGEVEAYDPNNPQASHFTQVVWKSATKLGCAISDCNLALYDPKWWPATYSSRSSVAEVCIRADKGRWLPSTVCVYDTGNVIGSFAQNVGSAQ